ncbi:MAG: hypothetical protein ACREM1_01085 [Longimicrobiales bacterium]
MAGGARRIDHAADEVGDLDGTPLRLDGCALEPVDERAPRAQQQRCCVIETSRDGAPPNPLTRPRF